MEKDSTKSLQKSEVTTPAQPDKTSAAVQTPAPKVFPKTLTVAGIIIISLIILLALATIIIVTLANNKPVNPVYPSATPEVTAVPTETVPLVSPTEIPTESLGKSKISLDIAAKPATSSVLNIFKTAKTNLDAHYYKLGSLLSGKIINKKGENVADLSGYDYIFVVYSTDDQGEYGYSPDFLRAFVKKGDAKIYVSGSTTNYSSSEFSALDAADFSGSVVDVSDYTEDIFRAIINPLYGKETSNTEGTATTYTSIQGNTYSYTELTPFIFDADFYTKVDNILGTDIYIGKSKRDMSFYKAYDNTLFHIAYIPLPAVSKGAVADLTWNNGQKNNDSYEYSSIGSCFEPFLELSSLPLTALKVSGKDSLGGNIYEPKDITNPDLIAFYKVYIDQEIYKYNSPKTDDITPLTKAEYLASHALFYWQDPFGRLIKFANFDYIPVGGCGKPAIYLYPAKATQLNVSVKVNGQMTFSRPVYPSGGWRVIANPDGKIQNLTDGQIYDYLWWEGKTYNRYSPATGFVVERSQLSAKLQGYLSQMGLNTKEISDFQEYWLPIMLSSQEQYFFLNFLQNEQVEKIAAINYSVKPDSEIRIFMVYKPLAEKLTLPEQQLQHFTRKGFVAVEWGGARL